MNPGIPLPPSPYCNSLDDDSSLGQRQRLLLALMEAGATGINTIQAQHCLNIMRASARVHELRREHGYNIQTIWTTAHTPEGHPHRVARYVLQPGKWQEVV